MNQARVYAAIEKHKISTLAYITKAMQASLSEVLEVYRQVCKNKLIAVYISGSAVRGESEARSDVDFYGVLKAPLTMVETKNLAAACTRISWQAPRGSGVDLKFFNSEDINSHLTILRYVVVTLDGCLLYGMPLYLKEVENLPMQHIAAAFIRQFDEVLRRGKAWSKNKVQRTLGRREYSKYLLRSIEWVAVLRGAVLSSSMKRYLNDIEEFAPEYTTIARECWRLRTGQISDTEQKQLERNWSYTLGELEKQQIYKSGQT